ncbi:hypothetical protein HA42_18040 [Pantoea deleyi]|nr:hypothetical protein HA42_18040 [Pantoea deleyi]
MTIPVTIAAMLMFPAAFTVALVPASLTLPLLATAPLFMTPPAAFVVGVAVIPPAWFTPASPIPVVTPAIAIAKIQGDAGGQSNRGAGGLGCVMCQRRQHRDQGSKNKSSFHYILLINSLMLLRRSDYACGLLSLPHYCVGKL